MSRTNAFPQRQARYLSVAILCVLFLALLAACGSTPTFTEPPATSTLAPIPSATPTLTLTTTLTPTTTPTATEVAAIPEELLTELDERYGEGNWGKREVNGNFYIVAGEKNVGVYVEGEWAILPENQPRVWEIPIDAEVMVEEGITRVRGAGDTLLWKWDVETSRWITDLSRVDVEVFSAWVYQVADRQLGSIDEASPFSDVHEDFYEQFLGPSERDDAFMVGVMANYEGQVIINADYDLDRAFRINAAKVRRADGSQARIFSLGIVKVNGQVARSNLRVEGESAGEIFSSESVLEFTQFVSRLMGKEVVIIFFWPKTSNYHIIRGRPGNKVWDGYIFASKEEALALLNGIYEGMMLPEDIPVFGFWEATDFSALDE